MHKQRLELMIDMLKEVDAGTWRVSVRLTPHEVAELHGGDIGFDLGEWLNNYETEAVSDDLDCDCTACAVGHAMLDKRFEDQGLVSFNMGAPMYDGIIGWWGVCDFFGLERDDADALFDINSYADEFRHDPLAVADRIREFIKFGRYP